MSKEKFDPTWLGLEDENHPDKLATAKPAEAPSQYNETLTNIVDSLECLQEIKIATQTIRSNQQQSLELVKGIHSMMSFFTVLTLIGLFLLLLEILIPVFRK